MSFADQALEPDRVRTVARRRRALWLLVLAWAGCATAGAREGELGMARTPAQGPPAAEGVSDAAPSSDAPVVAALERAPAGEGYWAGVRRRLARSPSGHLVAVACHNCYRQDLGGPAENLAGTIERIAAAQIDGADVIELDVRLDNGEWYVGHSARRRELGPLLEDVLRASSLAAGDQLLFLEIKERAAPEAELRALLSLLTSTGMAAEGRYAVVRAFEQRSEQLGTVERLLEEPEFAGHARFVRTHVLFKLEQTQDAGIGAMIDAAREAGAEGVELNYKATNTRELLELARARGLGTAVWTFPEAEGGALCRDHRELADTLTTDAPPDVCRAAIEQP